MSEKDTTCCVCEKQFSTIYNLAKHARKFHAEQVDLILPKKKTYNYKCTQCNKQFSLLKNYNYHKKKTHNTYDSESSASKYTECPICNLDATKEDLIEHFEVEHGIKCESKTIEFTSFEEFSTWKADMERDTNSKYVVERGSQCLKDGARMMKYCCHRSGKYVACGKGSRHLKTQGSNKIGGFCPARLKLIIDKSNKCKLTFINQHVGHGEDDLEHLFLTVQERRSLATKIALKMPFSQILNEIQGSAVESPLQRIHLIKRKDLHNIERSYNLQSTVVPHEIDAVGVHTRVKQRENSDERTLLISEDHKLASEKQKLIDKFTQLMERVTSLEQLEVVNKVLISLESTLEPISTKKARKYPPGNQMSGLPESSAPNKLQTECHKDKEEVLDIDLFILKKVDILNEDHSVQSTKRVMSTRASRNGKRKRYA